MSNTNGTNSFARSLNGIITYDDGAGTVIQNGTITTVNLAINNIVASNLATDCGIWEYNTGVTNYSRSCLGTVNLATGSKGNVNIGPVAGATSSGAINIGTASNLSGNIAIGNSSASSKTKLNAATVECVTFSATTIQPISPATTMKIGNGTSTEIAVRTSSFIVANTEN